MPATTSTLRRSPVHRRATTQRRLVEAALASLVEHGYAATTPGRVCERAGVTAADLVACFPVKADLLAEVARTVLPEAMSRVAAEGSKVAGSTDPVGDAVRLAVSAYRDPELAAVLELWVVGRTDRELATRLVELNGSHRIALYRLIRALLPPALAEHPDLIAVADLVLNASFGIAFALGGAAGESDLDDRVEILAAMCRSQLCGGSR